MKNLVVIVTTILLSFQSLASTTEQVWQQHIDAWVNRDLDAIISGYDDSSLMIVNNKIHRGQDEIREVFRNLFTIFDNGSNKIAPAIVEDRIIYIIWRFTPTGDKQYFGTDTFLIENGVIKVQTIASQLYDKYKF